MKGIWKVTQNSIAGERVYAVFRLRDTSRPDRSDNREHHSTGLMADKQEAQAIADRLNQEASEVKQA